MSCRPGEKLRLGAGRAVEVRAVPAYAPVTLVCPAAFTGAATVSVPLGLNRGKRQGAVASATSRGRYQARRYTQGPCHGTSAPRPQGPHVIATQFHAPGVKSCVKPAVNFTPSPKGVPSMAKSTAFGR